ncbi:MAG TPA: transcriptional regulator, partial [Planctomycetaceae bacterium]|nr:transcriptional regulator [Planctomycetaceae bacterium]
GLKHATVREVFDSFPASRGIDFTTVQTYLRRLEKKGYVNVKLEGRTRVYSPRIKPRTVIRETVDDLVDRLFAGETFPLMQHLIEDRQVSRADLDALKTLLDQLTEERDAAD